MTSCYLSTEIGWYYAAFDSMYQWAPGCCYEGVAQVISTQGDNASGSTNLDVWIQETNPRNNIGANYIECPSDNTNCSSWTVAWEWEGTYSEP